MSSLPAIQASPVVEVVNGNPVITTLTIAKYFGKQHRDVLRAVRNCECSAEFNLRNFAQIEYVDAKGRKYPAYSVTRDGFMFVGMGFTGIPAARLKEMVIAAFNDAERQSQERQSHKLEHAEREIVGFARQAARAERKLRILLERQLREIKRLLPKPPTRDDLTMTLPGLEHA